MDIKVNKEKPRVVDFICERIGVVFIAGIDIKRCGRRTTDNKRVFNGG
jgi:hypothetical protein